MVRRNIEEEHLEALLTLTDDPPFLDITRRLMTYRINNALKELKIEGVIEWDDKEEGWRLKKEAEG